MGFTLVDVLRNNGWFDLLGDCTLWGKNGIIFDTSLDCISGCPDGSIVNFKNHGDGVNVRFRLAERLAQRGSIL